MSEGPGGIAPRREIFIAFPPDLKNILHFACMHDRLLCRATLTPPVQHFDRTRQSDIIPWARVEHGKFLHFENFGQQAGLRQPREESAVRNPLRRIPPNWKKQKARQAFEARMHSEAHGMRRRSEANSPAVHRHSRSGAPTCGYLALGTGATTSAPLAVSEIARATSKPFVVAIDALAPLRQSTLT